MNVPWRTTVEPKTPATAAANARDGTGADRPRDGPAEARAMTKTASRTARRQRRHGPERRRTGREGRPGTRRSARARSRSPRTSIGLAAGRAVASRGRGTGAADRGQREVGDRHRQQEHRRQPKEPTSRPPMNGPTVGARRDEQVEQAERLAAPTGGAKSRISATELRRDEGAARPPGGHAPRRGPRTTPAARRAAEAAPNTRTPARNVGRWPNRSPSEPLTGSATATAPRYSVTSDATSLGVRPKVVHHARQGDGEHRGVQGDQDRAARDAEHPGQRASTSGGHRRGHPPSQDPDDAASCRRSRRARRRRCACVASPSPDHGGQPELAGDHRRVATTPPVLVTQAARDREQRDPRRVRRRAHDDVAGLDPAEVLRPRTTRAVPRATPGDAPVPRSRRRVAATWRAPVEPVGAGAAVGALPTIVGGRIACAGLIVRGARRSPRRSPGAARTAATSSRRGTARPVRSIEPSATSRRPMRIDSAEGADCASRSIQ